MSKRVMGKASFAHLRDGKGDIQISVAVLGGVGENVSQNPGKQTFVQLPDHFFFAEVYTGA